MPRRRPLPLETKSNFLRLYSYYEKIRALNHNLRIRSGWLLHGPPRHEVGISSDQQPRRGQSAGSRRMDGCQFCHPAERSLRVSAPAPEAVTTSIANLGANMSALASFQ
jgi:hypothetical protein